MKPQLTKNILPVIIGFAGFKRSGKDTLANLMGSLYGYTKFAFGDNIRKEVQEATGVAPVADAQKDDCLSVHDHRTYRDLLIEHGQARRAEDLDYWVKALAAVVDPLREIGKGAVISDVRMPNEIAWIRANGGVVVWVDRDGVESDGHETEQDRCDECDYGILNSGSPVGLVGKLVEMLLTQPSLQDRKASLQGQPLENGRLLRQRRWREKPKRYQRLPRWLSVISGWMRSTD
jgi:hypothetical protein